MPDSQPTETTAGGALGRVIGKAKSAVGSLLGNDELQREGNLQAAQSEAEIRAERATQAAEQRRAEAETREQRQRAEAERDQLEAELEAQERSEAIERREAQVEVDVDVDAAREKSAVETREEMKQRAADAHDQAALHRRAADAAEAARIENEARRAEMRADAIDPEEK